MQLGEHQVRPYEKIPLIANLHESGAAWQQEKS
jgi:hypothetical protein